MLTLAYPLPNFLKQKIYFFLFLFLNLSFPLQGKTQTLSETEKLDSIPTLIHWMPSETRIGIVLQDLHTILNHFPYLKPALVDTLRHSDIHFDVHKGTLSGLSLSQGMAFYWDEQLEMRIVLGLSDRTLFLNSLPKILKLMGFNGKVDSSATHVHISDLRPMRCGQIHEWWVCDTRKFEMESIHPLASSWSLNHQAWIMVDHPQVLKELNQTLPFPLIQGLHAHLHSQNHSTVISLDAFLNLPPPVAPFYTQVAQASENTVLQNVNLLTSFIASINLPLKTLFDSFGAQLQSQLPPSLHPLWQVTQKTFTGDIALSTNHSLLHPLLSLGIQNQSEGQRWLNEVCTAFGCTLKADPNHPSHFEILYPLDSDFHLRLHTHINETSLDFALYPSDLERLQSEHHHPHQAPSTFNQGLIGLMIHPSLGILSDLTSFFQSFLKINTSPSPSIAGMNLKLTQADLMEAFNLYSRSILGIYDHHVWIELKADRIRLNSLTRTLP